MTNGRDEAGLAEEHVLFERLQSSLSVLRFFKVSQAVVGAGWAVLAAGSLSSSRHALQTVGDFVVVVIPFLLVLLAVLHSRSRNRSRPVYNRVRDALRTRPFPPEQRTRAQRFLYLYQNYSSPPFVQGNASRGLVLAYLIVTFLVSIAIMIRMG